MGAPSESAVLRGWPVVFANHSCGLEFSPKLTQLSALGVDQETDLDSAARRLDHRIRKQPSGFIRLEDVRLELDGSPGVPNVLEHGWKNSVAILEQLGGVPSHDNAPDVVERSPELGVFDGKRRLEAEFASLVGRATALGQGGSREHEDEWELVQTTLPLFETGDFAACFACLGEANGNGLLAVLNLRA
jgi:hypothetical protein